MKQSLICSSKFLFLLCALLALLPTVPVQAQENAGGIVSGTIFDPTGRAVPNAAVMVKAESTGQVSRSVTTDQQGHFSVTGLRPGNYTIEVSARVLRWACAREFVRPQTTPKIFRLPYVSAA